MKLRRGNPTLPNIFDLQESIRDAARFQRKLGMALHMRANCRFKQQESSPLNDSLSNSWLRRRQALCQYGRTSRFR